MTTFPTRTAFREWLAAKPADEKIAYAWGCGNCPLALFSGYYVDPGAGGIFYKINPSLSPINKLPEWAKKFANNVDGSFNSPLEGRRPITAAQCLAILDAIP